MPAEKHSSTTPPTAKGSLPARLIALVRVGRKKLSANRRQTLLFGVVGSIVLVLPVVWVVYRSKGAHMAAGDHQKITLRTALDALDDGNLETARRYAERLIQRPAANQQGGPNFVLGAVAALEADEYLDEEKKNFALLAAGYLQEARERGFPKGREAQGLFLLGKSLFAAGRMEDCRTFLEAALAAGFRETSSIQRMLANAYSTGDRTDLERAQDYIRQYLADADLKPSDRNAGLLDQAKIAWQANDHALCQQVLDQIPPESLSFPEANLLRGRLLLQAARDQKQQLTETASEEQRSAVKKNYEQAIQVLRQAQDDPLGTTTVRQSMYLIGVCFLEMEDYRAALAQFVRTRQVYLDTTEGLAAGIEEADLLRASDQPDEALAAYRRVLEAAVKVPDLTNPWIPRKELQERLLSAYRDDVEAGKFERAIALAEQLTSVFPPARATELLAEANRYWASKLLSAAENLSEPDASAALKQGRALMRRAGRTFSQLAELEFTTRRYTDDLWQAAECLLEGHDFRGAVKAYDRYLQNEVRRRRPMALVGLGEALLALNRWDDSLAALRECTTFFPNDAATYRARLLAAYANMEKGETATAEALLRENLSGELLTPDSKEWRQSLFALGQLLHADGRHEEAIQRLEEAVARYPESSQTVKARYLIAEAYRQAAKVPQEKLLTDTIETARLAHRKQVRQLLAAAIAHYEQVQQSLNRRQERSQLTPLEKAILRNSYFALGTALFDLDRFEDAIRAYSAATNRYQHDPEVLEAFVQIANCYRRLNKPLEARGAVQQAKVVLSRMKADAPFAEATNYDRREWGEMLDWLGSL